MASSSGTRHRAADVTEAAAWVRTLTGCPTITHTSVAACTDAAHGSDPATWFYVEGDAQAGVARLRCLSGGHTIDVVDSAEHWTYPGVWSCRSCSQSLAEVVYGIHDERGAASWMVVAVRCVDCGDVAGLTDIVLASVPVEELLTTL